MSVAADPRRVPQVRRRSTSSSRPGFQAPRRFGRWNDPYLTMSPEYEAVIAGAFVDFLEPGYVYKGLKPVNWCINDRTALAEAEVEYENHTSPSIWVRFRLAQRPGDDRSRTRWPQRLRPHLDHHALDHPGQHGHRLPSRPSNTSPSRSTAPSTSSPRACSQPPPKPAAGENPRVVARFEGAVLERTVFRHPFLDRDSLGILADHVTLEQGTGAVHTAPGHGQEDYVVGQQYGIPIYCPVDAARPLLPRRGRRRTLPEELIGKTVWQANPIVIDDPEAARRAAGRRSSRPQLSALLALPQADHLPRHRAVVHRHGPRTICAPQPWRPSRSVSGCPPGARSASST